MPILHDIYGNRLSFKVWRNILQPWTKYFPWDIFFLNATLGFTHEGIGYICLLSVVGNCDIDFFIFRHSFQIMRPNLWNLKETEMLPKNIKVILTKAKKYGIWWKWIKLLFNSIYYNKISWNLVIFHYFLKNLIIFHLIL